MNRERITVLICLVLVTFCAAALTNTVQVSRRMTVITDEALALNGKSGPEKENLTKLDRKISEIDRNWEKYAPVVSTYSRHDELERPPPGCAASWANATSRTIIDTIFFIIY